MRTHSEIRAWLGLGARFALITTFAGGMVFATTPDAAAAYEPLQCSVTGIGLYSSMQVKNTTNRILPVGTVITFTVCNRNGCHKETHTVTHNDARPGEAVAFRYGGVTSIGGVAGDTTCTAVVWFPDGPRSSDMGNRKYGTPRVPATPPRSEPPLVAVSVPCEIFEKDGALWVVPKNTTGRHIPAGTKVEITVCTPKGCYKYVPDPEGRTSYAQFPTPPGEKIGSWQMPDTITSCTVKVYLPPDFFKERTGSEAPKVTRAKPPGPPPSGLLEDSPGSSRQSPSSVGTQKPTAPPPSRSGAAPLR